MRIAIPLSEDRLAQHFGHCEAFAFVDVDPGRNVVLASSQVTAPEHRPGLLPGWLKERGVTHVIAGHMGARARQLFADESIEVFIGAPSESAGFVAEQYLLGTLVAGVNTCDH